MNLTTFELVCTIWVVTYVLGGVLTAIYFSFGTAGKYPLALFMIGFFWPGVWLCVIGGSQLK